MAPTRAGKVGRGVTDVTAGRALRVYVGPTAEPLLEAAVRRAGGALSPLAQAEAAVWTDGDPATWLAANPTDQVRWVQLLLAGVEQWLAAGAVDRGRVWTSGRGASDLTVAEHAVALLLAVRRRLVECARATTWTRPEGVPLRGSTVLLVGAGAIGRALIPILRALDAQVIAVTRSGAPVPGAVESHAADALPRLWPRADVCVVAAPATAQTRHIVDREALRRMPAHGVVVNVARGSLVDTEALVDALRDAEIAGAALDVTDPEPLPDGHPLWAMPNALVTPHVANPGVAWKATLAARVEANVGRYLAGDDLLGVIDLERNY